MLEIATQKSIKFGDESFTPKINSEQLLRLQRAQMTDKSGVDSVKKLVAECFGDEKEKVAEYLEQVDFYQLALIQAYLVGGDEMVATMRRRMGEVSNG